MNLLRSLNGALPPATRRSSLTRAAFDAVGGAVTADGDIEVLPKRLRRHHLIACATM
jgi:hypothetical protein